MHEWAIAEGIIKAVEEQLRSGVKPSRIVVVAGELQNLDLEVMKGYLNPALSELVPEASVEYEVEEARFECRSCSFEWSLRESVLTDEEREAIHFLPEAFHAYIRCPRCGSRDVEVTSGRGVRLRIEY